MSTNPEAKQRGNDIGTTGQTVARNIKRLRRDAGLTQQELSDDLRKMGRPIPVASIGKIESGDRRVEVDDLVAIAIALGTNPNGLLLPSTRGPQDRAAITGHEAAAQELWEWAVGALPLDPESDWEDAEAQWSAFSTMSLPWWITTVKLIANAAEIKPGTEALMQLLYDQAQARTDAVEDPPKHGKVLEVTEEMLKNMLLRGLGGSDGQHQEEA